jgi:hypothetical protein
MTSSRLEKCTPNIRQQLPCPPPLARKAQKMAQGAVQRTKANRNLESNCVVLVRSNSRERDRNSNRMLRVRVKVRVRVRVAFWVGCVCAEFFFFFFCGGGKEGPSSWQLWATSIVSSVG